jgi:sugar phosphate permease
MSDRWTVGLAVGAVVCCAAPALIGAGFTGVLWGVVRDHWGWVVGGLGLMALAIIPRLRIRLRSRREL